ncbi:MAG TPA: excinuclease ABC subunit A, partial [Pirellulales bacterium]|nr:excinuclease ABC subunit A [Pirellulales bacterium]
MSANRSTILRGVEVHNLKHVDLDLPHRRLIVFCGVSGSGKSSLAFDTLYAEGQRRYIETFSAYTRQFLERLEKPAADRIDGIPPAIAVASKSQIRSSRSTIGTATEINDYLRLLFAKIGHVYCLDCGHEVRRDTPQSVAASLGELAAGTRFVVAFPYETLAARDPEQLASTLRQEGFVRAIVAGRLLNLDDREQASWQLTSDAPAERQVVDVVVDRLTAGGASGERLIGSLETAFQKGGGTCHVIVQPPEGTVMDGTLLSRGSEQIVDGRPWRRLAWSTRLACENCGREYPTPEPRLFSFNSPLGACPNCEGFGNIVDIDMELVVPDERKSLREGAIAPWNTPAYAHELQELLALAADYDLPVDVPYGDLNERQRQIIFAGVPERSFGGLRGFFAWLERRKYKMHIRVFLSRWRSYRPCPTCDGTRLRPEALAAQVGG